jgi:hypothetical protein
MATITKGYMTGGLIFDGVNLTDNRVITYAPWKTESRNRSGKRARPVGVAKLFDGTTVSSSKELDLRSVLWQYFYSLPPSRNWSATGSLIGAGHLGTGYSSNIPDKYWVNRLRSKIRDTDVNLAQAFAERKQTEKMFVDFGKRLLKAYQPLRRGNVFGVFNALLGSGFRPKKGWKETVNTTSKVAADHWLAWQYGVRPLISDLQGSVKEYYKVRGIRPLIRTYRVLAVNDERVDARSQDSNSLYVTTATQNANIRCYAEFQDSAQAWDQSAQRLGLTDPLLLAWELIPYSFVVDWFINVGSFLAASGSFSGLKRVGVHITTTTVTRSTANVKGTNATLETTVKSRVFRNTLPGATLSFNANPLSVSHVTSALALIRQLRF